MKINEQLKSGDALETENAKKKDFLCEIAEGRDRGLLLEEHMWAYLRAEELVTSSEKETEGDPLGNQITYEGDSFKIRS